MEIKCHGSTEFIQLSESMVTLWLKNWARPYKPFSITAQKMRESGILEQQMENVRGYLERERMRRAAALPDPTDDMTPVTIDDMERRDIRRRELFQDVMLMEFMCDKCGEPVRPVDYRPNLMLGSHEIKFTCHNETRLLSFTDAELRYLSRYELMDKVRSFRPFPLVSGASTGATGATSNPKPKWPWGTSEAARQLREDLQKAVRSGTLSVAAAQNIAITAMSGNSSSSVQFGAVLPPGTQFQFGLDDDEDEPVAPPPETYLLPDTNKKRIIRFEE